MELRKWLGFRPRKPRSAVRHSARLRVEPFEDRVVPAVVFTDEYDWGSPAGTATVTVTVTDDAPGYEGFFHWEYVLHNIDFGASEPYPPIGMSLSRWPSRR